MYDKDMVVHSLEQLGIEAGIAWLQEVRSDDDTWQSGTQVGYHKMLVHKIIFKMIEDMHLYKMSGPLLKQNWTVNEGQPCYYFNVSKTL